jgi:gluconate kinase
MPETSEPVPTELSEWVESQLLEIRSLVTKIKRNKPEQHSDRQSWLTDVLQDVAAIEKAAKRTNHLLTAYAIRTRSLRPTTVGKLTDVTITTAQTRAGSHLAETAWTEIWPPSKTMPPAGIFNRDGDQTTT